MQKLSINSIIGKIKKAQVFDAIAEDGSFRIRIEEYAPIIGAAIHAGSNFRNELKEKTKLNDFDRWYEEDPNTEQFIEGLPITIWGEDSRYEYDLNRDESSAVYEEAWGKKVYHEPLSKREKENSIKKHKTFYQVILSLVSKLEEIFGACLVFDVHSYNYKRIDKDAPLFNLGTENIDKRRYKTYINHWLGELSKIKLEDIENKTEENGVFYGRGYFLKFITENTSNTLVLATEIKKVYCDELNGVSYPVVIQQLRGQLKKAMLNTAFHFAKYRTNLQVKHKLHLLSDEMDKAIVSVDKRLFQRARSFEILQMVNPINIESERRKFIRNKFKQNPVFKYRHIPIDPHDFKKQLYELPAGQIHDINIQLLYKDIIRSYADKADIIASVGKQEFFYNSLRYFGEPEDRDIRNANYLLYAPTLYTDKEKTFTDVQAGEFFMDEVRQYGFDCKLEIVPNLVSKALVINARKTIQIKKGAIFTERSLKALTHHEIGVHMVTTMNARLHQLKMPWLGMPLNTKTQEGLAVLAEFLSGNLTIRRLKELALRVLGINKMIQGAEFTEVFSFLKEEGRIDENHAFLMTARIFRGGGFTKDYLYLKGFKEILKHYYAGRSLDTLLIGKTSLKYKALLNEMIERKMLVAPKYKTRVFEEPAEVNPILEYLVKGLR